MLKNASGYFLPVIGVVTFLIPSFITPVRSSAAGTRTLVRLRPPRSGTSASRKASTTLPSYSADEQNQLGYDLRNMVRVIGFEESRGNDFEKSSVVMPNGITRPAFCLICEPYCVFVSAPPCKAPPLTVFALATTGFCGVVPVNLSFTVTGPDGKPVPVLATDSLGMVEFTISDFGEYRIEATDEKGNKGSGVFQGLMSCCSFSQTEWSQNTPRFNGKKRVDTIRGLLRAQAQGPTPLYVGVKGLRSIAFPKHGDASCILSRLPASGDPLSLPEQLGDATMNPDSCKTSPRLPMSNGKLQNELLGNVLALRLNLALDVDIGGLVICESMVVYKALPGSDGLLGTGDEIIDPGPDGILGTTDDPIRTITISPNVITALSVLHLPRTISGLSALANTALAGDIHLGGASLQDINTAVSMINTAFSQCGFFITCATGKSQANLQISITRPTLVSGSCGRFPYSVTLDEYGDAGITITRLTVDYYSSDLPEELASYLFTESFNSDDFANLFNKCTEASNHIAPGGRKCGTLCAALAPGIPRAHALILNFYGADDDGNEISFATPPVFF
jgi:hypothetical protein